MTVVWAKWTEWAIRRIRSAVLASGGRNITGPTPALAIRLAALAAGMHLRRRSP